MRNMAVLHSPAFSYPLPVLVRVLFNLLIFKGRILYYNKYKEKRRIYEGNSFKFRPNSIFSNLYPRRFSSMAAPIRNIVRQERAKT